MFDPVWKCLQMTRRCMTGERKKAIFSKWTYIGFLYFSVGPMTPFWMRSLLRWTGLFIGRWGELFIIWLRHKLKESQSLSVRPSSPSLVCLELSIFIFLAQVTLLVSLRFLKYFDIRWCFSCLGFCFMYSNSDNLDSNWCFVFYTDTLCLHAGLEVGYSNIFTRIKLWIFV